MIFVMNLPLGWRLYAVPGQVRDFGNTYVPIFRHPNRPGEYKPDQLAFMEGARAIFHALMRQLRIMDLTWVHPGEDPRFKAVDKARLKMEMTLREIGNWDEELLETGIEAGAL